MKIVLSSAAVLCLAAAASAQDETARKIATEVAARVPLEKALKGAPYSAETVIESSQQLADGNRISQRTTGRVYRDGEGRTRREEDRKDGSVTVSIVDPVGGFSYSLDPQNKIAWRTPVGVGGGIFGKIEAAQTQMRKVEAERSMTAEGRGRVEMKESTAPASQIEQEKVAAAAAAARGSRGGGGSGGFGGAIARSRGPEAPLERKVMDGIPVEGRTTRTVIPAGAVGNEQPLVISNEEWRSTDLNVLVMTRHTDPRSGESSYRLSNIVRAEPDPSLFMVPADYTVQDTGIRRMEPARK